MVALLRSRHPLPRREKRRVHRVAADRAAGASMGGDACLYAADAARAFSSACCCSVVRLVRMTVPPNLAISGKTRSALVLRAITKSPDPPGAIESATSLIHLSSM